MTWQGLDLKTVICHTRSTIRARSQMQNVTAFPLYTPDVINSVAAPHCSERSVDTSSHPSNVPLKGSTEWKFSPLTGKKLSWVVCFMDCESLWLPGDCISVVEHRQLKPGALGYGWLFTFLCFTSKTYIFPSEATCSYSNQPCIWEACTENPSLELKKVKTKLYGLENYRVKHTSSVHNYFKQSCHKLKWQLWIHQQQK